MSAACRQLCMVSPEPMSPEPMYGVPGTCCRQLCMVSPEPHVPGTSCMVSPGTSVLVWCPRKHPCFHAPCKSSVFLFPNKARGAFPPLSLGTVTLLIITLISDTAAGWVNYGSAALGFRSADCNERST